MSERNRMFILILIMIVVSFSAVGITIRVLYKTAFQEQRERLVETAQSQARLIEAVTRFDSIYSSDYPEGSIAATLSQIIDARRNYKGFGETGEFTLARREGEYIVFLLSHRHFDLDNPKPIRFNSDLAEAMRLALSGKSGTIVGLDYRGETVLAAHEPVKELNLGIVAKIDLVEIRRPFVTAGLAAGGFAILIVFAGAALFLRISNPIISRLKEQAAQLTTANEKMTDEIEERERAEVALRKAHDELDQVYNLAPVGMLLLDPDYRILRINQRLADIDGATVEEHLGHTLDEVVPELAEDLKEIYRPVFEKGEPVLEVEIHGVTPKEPDVMRDWLGYYFPQKNDDGEVVGLIGAVIEITERKWAEEALKKAHDELEQRVEERTAELTAANEQLTKEIYGRKRTEEALQESETRYRAIFEQAADSITLIDVETGALVEFNEMVYKNLGYTRAEFENLKMSDIEVNESEEEINEHINIVLNNGLDTFETKHRMKTGEIRDIHVSSKAISIRGRDFIHGIWRDISDLKRTEEALRESEGKYRFLFENMLNGFAYCKILLDEDNQPVDFIYLEVNDAFEEITGLRKEDVCGRKVTEAIPTTKETHPELFDIYGKVALTGEEAEFDIYFKPLEKWLSISVYSPQKEYFVAIFENITDRKRAEEALRESEERYRTILENMEEGYYEVDLAGKFTFFNDAMSKIRGISRDKLMGMGNRDYMSPETAKEVYEAFNKVYITGEPSKNLEWLTIRPDGTQSYLETSTSLIKGSGDEPIGFRGIVRDVNERKRSEEDKKKLEAQLQQSQKMESLGRLVTGVAHEINNPNNFIFFNIPIMKDYLQEIIPIVDGYAKDLPDFELCGMSYPEFREDIFKLLDNIEHGSKRINSTVSALTEFARKKDKVEMRLVDFKQVIEKGVAICRSKIDKMVKLFEVNIPENLPQVYTDSGAIEQVLINLLVNAAQAADKEDSWVRLSVSLNDTWQNHLIIEVRDNGCGMDKKTLGKIFDPFFTTKQPGEGTGLGLSVCHTLIEEIKGRIDAESEPGKGSTFRIILS